MSKHKIVATIELEEPVEYGNEVIEKLEIRKPKGRHYRKMPIEPKTAGDVMVVAEELTGQPGPVIDELSFEDAHRLMVELGKLFSGSRTTGSTG